MHGGPLWPGTRRMVSHSVQNKGLQRLAGVAAGVAPAGGQVTPEQLSLAVVHSLGHVKSSRSALLAGKSFC